MFEHIIHDVLHHRVNPKTDCDDILQDVRTRIAQAIVKNPCCPALRSLPAFIAYLRKSVTNAALDANRQYLDGKCNNRWLEVPLEQIATEHEPFAHDSDPQVL